MLDATEGVAPVVTEQPATAGGAVAGTEPGVTRFFAAAAAARSASFCESNAAYRAADLVQYGGPLNAVKICLN